MVENNPARQKESRRVIDTASRIIATSQEIAHTFAHLEPLAIETGDGQHVRHIHFLHKRLRLFR